MTSLEADCIIVGAGTAGCVLADRLSADDRHSVALLELGRDTYPWIHIPVGYAKTMFNTRVEPVLPNGRGQVRRAACE